MNRKIAFLAALIALVVGVAGFISFDVEMVPKAVASNNDNLKLPLVGGLTDAGRPYIRINTGKVDTTAVQASDTTGAVSGSTLPIYSGISIYEGLRVDVACGGTISGTSGAKNIDILVGSTTLAQLDSTANADYGDLMAEFTVLMSGNTAYEAFGAMTIANGTTVVSDADWQSTSGSGINMGDGRTMKVQIQVGDTADAITLESCAWKVAMP